MSNISEFQIQMDFNDWCMKQSFILECWHVPNGIKASPKACLMMKKIGLRKGVCDYWILLKNKKLIVIEFKDDVGVLSTEQERFIESLKHCNIPVAVCYSAFEGVQFVKSHMG